MADKTDKSFSRVSKAQLAKFLWIFAGGICILLTVIAECERIWWRAYLVAQFRVELFAISILLTVILLTLRQSERRLMFTICVFLCALLNLSHLLPYYAPRRIAATSSGKTMRLLQINLNVKNRRYEEVTKYIRDINADAVLIAELTPEWNQYFSSHLTNYSHTIAVPRIDTYGIGVYSKAPLTNGQVEYFGDSGHPSVTTQLSGLEKTVSILHTHVQGPVKKPFFKWHKQQFELMRAKVNALPKPLVMSGDMNSNAWTYLITDFLSATNLDDTQWGNGISLSWPTPFYLRYGICPLLSIDHFFVSKDVIVLQRKLGKPIGSDHYPVILELSLKR